MKKDIDQIILAVLVVVAVGLIAHTANKQGYINGQINGYVLGCKNTGTPYDECQRRSVRYERWLRCDQNQKQCN